MILLIVFYKKSPENIINFVCVQICDSVDSIWNDLVKTMKSFISLYRKINIMFINMILVFLFRPLTKFLVLKKEKSLHTFCCVEISFLSL